MLIVIKDNTMKILSTIFLFLLYFISGYSQTIPLDSFYKQGTTWTETQTLDISGWKFDHREITGIQYELGNDTVISGKTYHLLEAKRIGTLTIDLIISTETHNALQNYTDFSTIGCIRTDSNKVFFLLTDTSSVPARYLMRYYSIGIENKIYDFNLSKGDTLNILGSVLTVQEIDSVRLNTGNYIKRYLFDSVKPVKYFNYWLQGIGSNFGLLNPNKQTFLIESSLCYNNSRVSFNFTDSTNLSNAYLYERELYYLYNSCFSALSVNNNTIRKTELMVYPNPLSDNTIHIESGSNDKIEMIVIYDVTGREQYRLNKPFASATDNTIIIPTVQKGAYLVKVFFSDNSCFTKPLMKY